MDRGATYSFLPGGDGNITGGGGYNIFAVNDGALHTPARGVLLGVTRKIVLEIAAASRRKAVVDFLPVDLLYHADEIFKVTTAGGVMLITTLDGQPVGGDQVGPVSRELWEAYWAARNDAKYCFSVDDP